MTCVTQTNYLVLQCKITAFEDKNPHNLAFPRNFFKYIKSNIKEGLFANFKGRSIFKPPTP
jgi:hypothetical protein